MSLYELRKRRTRLDIVHTYPPFEYHLIVFLEVRTRRMAVSTHPYCIMVSCSPQEIIQHLHLEK